MPRVLTPLAESFAAEVPPFFATAHELRAVWYAYARKLQQLEDDLELVRRNLNPITADELGMPWWETLVNVTVEPAGQTIEQRRATVVAFLGSLLTIGSGVRWEQAIDLLLGPGWSYQEYDPFGPQPPNGPPQYTVWINVPFGPTSAQFSQIERFARTITPAHIDIVLRSPGGFVLDVSQLDQEVFSG